jgi:transcriptional regulator with XRE-family HTH domain
MNWLKYLRMQRGLSQPELAKRLGITSSFLSRIECGWQARVPAVLESRLRGVFGEEWDFKALMERVPASPEELRQCQGAR